MTNIGFPPSCACELRCDNKTTINILENSVKHDHTKHIEVDWHFIKEKLEAGIIKLLFVRFEDQLGDILTKALN